MTIDPARVEVTDHIAEAKRLFELGEIHHLPVVDNGRLVGIVSSSDLLKLHLLDGDPALLPSATIREIMEANPVVLESGASLRDAATTLSMGKYHALPVVEPDRSLVGIVTTSDLVIHLLKHIPRGDGSVRENVSAGADSSMDDVHLSQTIRRAEQVANQESDPDGFARLILYFRDQNRLLQSVRAAADLYLRSGQGEREHSVLVKRLADLQRQ